MNLESAQRGATSSGKRHLVDYLQGRTITRGQATAAKCFECMGGYADGKVDCRVPACPLYPWMPFRESKPPSNRPALSVEHRELLRKRLSEAREAKKQQSETETQ